MKGKTLIGTECVRINGTWRVVEVWADVLLIACRLGPKAAKNKSGHSKACNGGIAARVRPGDDAKLIAAAPTMALALAEFIARCERIGFDSAIGTEVVRINGAWRVVEVWADVLLIACRLGPKAAKNKSGHSKACNGGIAARVRPQ